jgi:hypothetical protein
MNEDDKEYKRTMFAGFALCGAIMSRDSWTPKGIWDIADAMIEAENEDEPEEGIVSIKKRKYVRKN